MGIIGVIQKVQHQFKKTFKQLILKKNNKSLYAFTGVWYTFENNELSLKSINSLICNYFIAHKMADKVSHPVIHGRTYYMNFRLNDSTSFVRRRSGTVNLK